MDESVPVIEVSSLGKTFRSRGGMTHVALEDVSFQVSRGEVLGIVGESGSGKTTLVRVILRLTTPTSGRIVVQGIDVWQAKRAERKRLPSLVQVVFQDPYASLDPRLSIAKSISEGSARVDGKKQAAAAVEDLLDLVSLPRSAKDVRPAQLSGGQRQRVAIARALAMRPPVLVADEPVSALDVSMQGQVLNLLRDLKSRLNLTCIFVSHDLSIVQQFCDRVIVMEKGRIVEEGEPAQVFTTPTHPYTQSLVRALPRISS
ncbi:MAG: ABC transporter ATP-binding protein [Streptosporangiaceae bacterium]